VSAAGEKLGVLATSKKYFWLVGSQKWSFGNLQQAFGCFFRLFQGKTGLLHKISPFYLL
jgi:hypothetical protein